MATGISSISISGAKFFSRINKVTQKVRTPFIRPIKHPNLSQTFPDLNLQLFDHDSEYQKNFLWKTIQNAQNLFTSSALKKREAWGIAGFISFSAFTFTGFLQLFDSYPSPSPSALIQLITTISIPLVSGPLSLLWVRANIKRKSFLYGLNTLVLRSDPYVAYEICHYRLIERREIENYPGVTFHLYKTGIMKKVEDNILAWYDDKIAENEADLARARADYDRVLGRFPSETEPKIKA